MAKYKYKFNHETLSFEKVEFKVGEVLFRKIIPGILLSSIIGIFLFIFISPYIESPLESRHKERVDDLRFQYELLYNDLENAAATLDELQKRDDKLYRMIYGIAPLPQSKRLAGIGGSEKYNNLKNYSFGKQVTDAKRKVDENMRRMLVQSESYNELIELVKDKEKMASHIPAIQPIAPKDLTRFGSPFGMRMHPIHKCMKMHYGVDLTAPTGTPIYAPGDGVVFRSGWGNGFGNHVRIDHGYGYVTVYGHMSKIRVRAGQKVKRGDIIGEVGSTGLSTSPHLHYEVRINGEWVNPVNFYYNDLSDEDFEKMVESSENSNTHVFE